MIAFHIKSLDLNLNETDAEGVRPCISPRWDSAVPTILQPDPGQSSYGPAPVTSEVDVDGLKRGR